MNRFAGKFTKPVRSILYGTSTDPDEEALRAVVSKYFNVNLKEQSGAAVTENELTRMQNAYGLDVFGSASALLDAIRRDARLKQEQAKGFAAAIAPEFRGEILGRQGTFSVPDPIKRPAAGPAGTVDTGLDAQKRARLEELRKKKAAGTLR